MSLTATVLALCVAQTSPAATKPQIPPRPTGAPAATIPAATTPGAPAAAAQTQTPDFPRFGVSLETSFPQGVGLSVLYRPVNRVRLWAGPAWNYVAWGVQGGAGFALANWGITPVLSVEAARFFGADLSYGGVPDELQPLLQDVSMDYAATHLGLEMGSPRGFSFSIRVGLSWVWVQTRGEGTVVNDAGTPDESRVTFADPSFSAAAPSVKLGFNYWF
jgi:hypothetical protein